MAALGLAGLVALLIAVAPVWAQSTPLLEVTPFQMQLVEALDGDPLSVLDRASEKRRARMREAALAFYERREWKPAWVGREAPPWIRLRITRELEGAVDHGLRPAEYRVEELLQRMEVAPDSIETEAAITLSLLVFTEHLSRGRLDPEDARLEWNVEPPEVDLAQALADFARGRSLAEQAPRAPAYRDLQEILRAWLDVWRQQGRRGDELAPVPAGEAMKEGGLHDPERLLKLADRLATEGALSAEEHQELVRRFAEEAGEVEKEGQDEAAASAMESGTGSLAAQVAPSATPQPYPGILRDGVKRYQERQGLIVDGVAGSSTLAALNESLAQRIERIVVNLERWRWLPDLPVGRYLRVNIPAFRLQAFESTASGGLGLDGTRCVLELPVVVGKPSWATPIFRAPLAHVVINPAWNIPRSIAINETLPAIKKDPGYIEKKGLELIDRQGAVIDPSTIDWNQIDAKTLDFRFRQRLGPTNALGQIKFLLPNQFSVFLHDTPSRSDFNLNQRARSHGCIRVERPQDLAEFVLAGIPGWSKEEIERVIQNQQERWIRLDEEIPVWIVYFTALRSEDGRPLLREDIYGIDEQVRKILDERYGGLSFLEATAAVGEGNSRKDVTNEP